jgi:hypothetical protein
MSWSLHVQDGDFVLDSAHLGMVTGATKLGQDFRHFLLERMGTDSMHLDYGSLLDGGMQPDGTIVPSPIGETNWNHVALMVDTEIRRIVSIYQSRQIERAKSDRLRYNKDTLTAGEILASADIISMTATEDQLLVKVRLVSGNADTLTLEIGLPGVVTF